jgi:hypothetical protein
VIVVNPACLDLDRLRRKREGPRKHRSTGDQDHPCDSGEAFHRSKHIPKDRSAVSAFRTFRAAN